MKTEKNNKKIEFKEDKIEKSKEISKNDFSNSMTIGSTTKRQIWRPNNYRRQIEIKHPINLTRVLLRGTIGSTSWLQNQGIFPVETKIHQSEHTKLITIEKFKNCIIQIGKTKITAIHPQNVINGKKETFLLEGETLEEIKKWIFDKKQAIQKELDEALFVFCDLHNLQIKNKPKWSRYEDFLRGDDYLDKIPKDTIIHARIGKKVYDEGWEWHNSGDNEEPTERMVTYIENQSLTKNMPIIEKRFKEIEAKIDSFETKIDSKIDSFSKSFEDRMGEYINSSHVLERYAHEIALHLVVEERQLDVSNLQLSNQIKMNESLDKMNRFLEKLIHIFSFFSRLKVRIKGFFKKKEVKS
jgi:hypothetical protein